MSRTTTTTGRATGDGHRAAWIVIILTLGPLVGALAWRAAHHLGLM